MIFRIANDDGSLSGRGRDLRRAIGLLLLGLLALPLVASAEDDNLKPTESKSKLGAQAVGQDTVQVKGQDLHIQKFQVDTLNGQWHFWWLVRNVGNTHAKNAKFKIQCEIHHEYYGWAECPSGMEPLQNLQQLWPAQNPDAILASANAEMQDVASGQVVTVTMPVPNGNKKLKFKAWVIPEKSTPDLGKGKKVLHSKFDPSKRRPTAIKSGAFSKIVKQVGPIPEPPRRPSGAPPRPTPAMQKGGAQVQPSQTKTVVPAAKKALGLRSTTPEPR